MTYMLLLNCALKLVEELILYYDARSKKHQTEVLFCLSRFAYNSGKVRSSCSRYECR